MGALLCLAGALTNSLYKGPAVIRHQNDHPLLVNNAKPNYLRGTMYLFASVLSYGLWFIFQVNLLKVFHCKYLATMLICIIAAAQQLVIGLCIDHSKSSWSLGINLNLLTIIYSGAFATAATFCLVSWAIAERGPTYPSMFNPLALITVAVVEALFVSQDLKLGSTTTTMARTRRTSSVLERGTPTETTQKISSTVEVPPHSTYAVTQGGAQVGATEPQPQGTIPPTPQGSGHAAPEVGGSGHAARSEARGKTPPYIQGLAHIPEDQEFSGPYTERDSESSNDEVAPRRRCVGKKLMADGNHRTRSTRGVNPQLVQERIKTHEAAIQRLKRDLEAQQVPRPPLPPRGRNPPPIIDLDGPLQRRVVVPRADLNNLLSLGDPDEPTPPFTEEIMNAHISRKFKMPTIKAYDGAGDPANHVRTFSNALLLQPVNDAIKCLAFPQTLSGMAKRWYSHFPPNSIGSFRELSQTFIKQFISGRVHEKSSASFMSIVQRAKESLRDYLNRFTKEALKVPDLDDKIAMIALQQGIRDEFFKMSLAKRPPESMLQLQDRAGKYIKVEESIRKTVVSNEPAGGTKRKTDLKYIAKDKYPRTEQSNDSTPKKGGPGQKFTEYAKLNAPRSRILMEIEKD
ncbi:hypothetical protein AgCh_009570 [Apium graveolens]